MGNATVQHQTVDMFSPEETGKLEPIDRTEEYRNVGIVGNGDVVTEVPGDGLYIKRGCGTLRIAEDDPVIQKLAQADAERAQAIAEGKKECEHCGEMFMPRTGTGGKKQKFCGEPCRREADAERKANAPQRGQREAWKDEKADLTKGQFVDAIAATEKALKPPAAKPFVPDFDWSEDECVIIPEQQATAVYFNNDGSLVIRQQSWPDEDDVIIITKPCIDGFMDQLCDALGIPSSGKL